MTVGTPHATQESQKGWPLLAPLTPSEVASILEELADALERRPHLQNDPAFMGSMRLALTAASASRVHVERVYESAPPVEVVREVVREVPVFDATSLTTLNLEVERLKLALTSARSELEEANMERVGAQVRLEEVATKLKDARAKIAKVIQEHTDRVEQLQAEAVAQCTDRDTRLATTREQVAKLESNRDQVVKLLQAAQFSGQSAKYQFQKTRKPIPCCPICGGLTTDAGLTADKDVGHRKNCWISGALLALTR